MKTLNFFLAALLLSGITFGATSPATMPAATGEYWISPSPNTFTSPLLVLPLGSLFNPLDGSTAAKFDAVMQSLPPYSYIHLDGRVFQSMGDTVYGPKTGWHVVGNGMYLTTIQFPSNAVVTGQLNRAHLVKPLAPYFQTNICYEDLTLDCNYQPALMPTNETLNGISLPGSDNVVRRVRVINAAAVTTSAADYVEAWGIFEDAWPYADAWRNVIEECVVTDAHCNYHNDVYALGFQSGSGRILNNTITQAGTNLTFGINYGTHDILISGNQLIGVMLGSHSDSGTGLTNAQIIHNQYVNCNTALDCENGILQDVTIADNDIVLTNTTGVPSTVQAIYLHPTENTNVPAAYYNVTIKDNSVRVAGTNAFPNQRFMFAYDARGLFVQGNRVDAALANYFDATCSGVVMRDNYDLLGNPCPTVLPVPVPAPAPQFSVLVAYPTNAPVWQVVYPTNAPVVTIKQN